MNMDIETSTREAARQAKAIAIVKAVVAEHYDYPLAIMESEDRHQPVAKIRQIAMCLARELSAASYPDLARAFAKKDHNTIIHAFNSINARCATDAELRRTFELLRERSRSTIKKAA